MKQSYRILKLFFQFMKFGCFTFGGGWSIVAQMQKLYVEQEKAITNEDLLDLTSVGRSLPGTMIGNVALLYGYRSAGFWGGLACLFGMVIPPLLVLIVVTSFYTAIQDNHWVMAVMAGIRASIVPIIACAAMKLIKGALKYTPCILVTIVSALMYLFFNINGIWIALMGVICGILICEHNERTDQGNDSI